jgi:hypothetical protein
VTARARYWAEKAAKMPADGVVIAKEAFRLVEQSQAYRGEEVASCLFHAFGTNLQFAPGEFNFVKTRAQHGTKEAFRLRANTSTFRNPKRSNQFYRTVLRAAALRGADLTAFDEDLPASIN